MIFAVLSKYSLVPFCSVRVVPGGPRRPQETPGGPRRQCFVGVMYVVLVVVMAVVLVVCDADSWAPTGDWARVQGGGRREEGGCSDLVPPPITHL